MLSLLLAITIVGMVYWPATSNGYVWDDVSLFVRSESLRKGGDIWGGIVQPILPGTTYFRPLVLATFAAEFQFGDPDPRISHLVNLIFHIANSALVGFIALLVAGRSGDGGWRTWSVAGLGALVYGLHPALIEDAVWVASRFDLMATTFSLLFLLGVLLQPEKITGHAVLALVLLAGLFSKEMAITAPVIAIFYIFVRDGLPNGGYQRIKLLLDRRILALLAVAFVAMAIYLLTKVTLIGSTAHVDNNVVEAWPGLMRLSLVGKTIFFYFKMTFLPFLEISPQHPFTAVGQSIFGLVLAGLTTCVYCLAIFGGPLIFRANFLLFAAVLVSYVPVLISYR